MGRRPFAGASGGAPQCANQQRVQTVPTNLDADAQEDKRRQPYYHAGSRRSQLRQDPIGVAVTKEDADGDDQNADGVRQSSHEQWPNPRRWVGAESERNRDRTRAHGERHGQGIERTLAEFVRVTSGGPLRARVGAELELLSNDQPMAQTTSPPPTWTAGIDTPKNRARKRQ